MFDFSLLTAVVPNDGDNTYSFVGIGGDELRLPKGCAAWASQINSSKTPAEKFIATKDAFLSLYKTLRTYRNGRKGDLVSDRDSAQVDAEGGREILGEYEDNEVIYYRHLDMLDSILDASNELGILSLAQRLGRSEQLDHAKLYRHLDRAIYFDDGRFMVDEMTLPRRQIIVDPVEVVQMYCFVLVEISSLLNEHDALANDIRVLGEQFFERHLAQGDSLFAFETWRYTRDILRERLVIIDQNTAFKDDGYHELYDALVRFLYGSAEQDEKGIQWGISSFAPVWESLCLTYLIDQHANKIIACDTTGLSDELKSLPSSLTHKQELLGQSKLVARLHTNSDLANVFVLNGDKLFPDCILVKRLLETVQKSVYQSYGVQSLSDSPKNCTPLVEPAFQEFWQGLKSRNGPTQRAHAPKLFAFIQTTTPNDLTAFFLGRAIAAGYESKNGAIDSREKIFTQLIDDSIGSRRNVNILRGIIWETYFDKNDQLREDDDLDYRQNRYGFKRAMDSIGSNKGTYPQLEDLFHLSNFCKAIVQEEKRPKNCIIIDFKYLTEEYFDKNTFEVRERSVRKQFVYEYLLAQNTGGRYSISSEFWIPSFDVDSPDTEFSTSNSSFLGASIPLRHINVARLMTDYWQ